MKAVRHPLSTRRASWPWIMPMLMLLCSAVLPRAAAAEAIATRVDAGWILQALAQPAPMRTEFVELRGSPLLQQPLRIEGQYQRPDADTLVRDVRTPYLETTTLRKGQASIARPGKPVRTFALSRVPELAQLQASFGALLSGDRILLERHYRLAAQGTREEWTLVLTPMDAKLKGTLRDITLHGRNEELRCIETRPTKGDLQRTLLGSAAKSAAGTNMADALASLCRSGSAS
jgi:hypothetical protein